MEHEKQYLADILKDPRVMPWSWPQGSDGREVDGKYYVGETEIDVYADLMTPCQTLREPSAELYSKLCELGSVTVEVAATDSDSVSFVVNGARYGLAIGMDREIYYCLYRENGTIEAWPINK